LSPPARTLRKPLRAAALAIASALALAGCQKTVDAGSAESLVTRGFKAHSRLAVKEVSCPSDVPLQAGTTFQCTAKTSKRGRFLLTLAILDDHGNLRVIDLKPVTRTELMNR
jgi:uncharacterized protein DUF4333